MSQASVERPDFNFVPPTTAEGEMPDYSHLRPPINDGEAIFEGLTPFQLMEHMGAELAAEQGVTKWAITYDLQEACGVHLSDKQMQTMLAWADEEIQRQRILRQELPPDQTRRELMKNLYGIEIEDNGPPAKVAKA